MLSQKQLFQKSNWIKLMTFRVRFIRQKKARDIDDEVNNLLAQLEAQCHQHKMSASRNQELTS